MSVCPSCYSKRMKKYDLYHYKGRSKPRWQCQNCGFTTAYPLQRVPKSRSRRTINWFTSTMFEYGFADVWYAHPGPGNYHWNDRWHIGIWTGPQVDLICVKLCNTNEEAKEYLSPGAANPFEALEKAIALHKERGLSA